MEKEFIGSNIVVLGHFNPTDYDKLFFIKNNFFSEDEFLNDSSVLLQNISKIYTKDMEILITKNQVLFSSKSGDYTVAFQFISLVQRQQKMSLVLNLKWLLIENEDRKNIIKLTKKKFYPIASNIINEEFNEDSSAFGYYASKDFCEGRFIMNINPVSVSSLPDDEEFLALSFEFNYNIDDLSTSKSSIQDVFEAMQSKSENIVSNFN